MLTNIVKLPLIVALCTTCLFALSVQAQIAPPALGDETKGLPADVTETTKSEFTDVSPAPANEASDKGAASVFDSPTVTESRRENGQVYRIEMDHAIGGKQVIEENDSDGKIESTSNDIEETPNLPKWKLGSW